MVRNFIYKENRADPVTAWSNAGACDCSLAGIEFVFHPSNGCLICVFSAVSTTALSIVQSIPNECGLSLSLIKHNSNPLHLQWVCRNRSEKERKKYFTNILIYLSVPIRYFVSSFQNQCSPLLFWYSSSPVRQGLLSLEVSGSHATTKHSR
jgi:hypothetical protein